jgi:Asp-tRNA(Asn)/Glu-tRNA(Gln) amidotransferase A subunit family amidase
MQIIGRRHADEDLLAISAAFERARPWFQSYIDLETKHNGN